MFRQPEPICSFVSRGRKDLESGFFERRRRRLDDGSVRAEGEPGERDKARRWNIKRETERDNLERERERGGRPVKVEGESLEEEERRREEREKREREEVGLEALSCRSTN